MAAWAIVWAWVVKICIVCGRGPGGWPYSYLQNNTYLADQNPVALFVHLRLCVGIAVTKPELIVFLPLLIALVDSL